jgi:hypothetical protein
VEGGGSVTFKFYTSTKLLMHEQKLYDNEALAPLLPQCIHCCPGGHTPGGGLSEDEKGSKLPPFVILEEFETLEEVLMRARPTFLRAVKVRFALLASNGLIK